VDLERDSDKNFATILNFLSEVLPGDLPLLLKMCEVSLDLLYG
jgi:hypothetical protein